MDAGGLFIVCGPSGSGKNTLIEAVLERDPQCTTATTATTRAPRPGEVDGEDYFFYSQEEFERRVAQGDFVEWARVHGRCYGTLRNALKDRMATGKDVLLHIDVQGARSIRRSGLDAVTIFIKARSIEELETRLRKRGADSEDEIARRMQTARAELAAEEEFDYIVVNEDIETAVQELMAIIAAARRRRCTAEGE